MDQIRFIHLSDSHILKNGEDSNMLEGICSDTTETQRNNTQNFKKLLEELSNQEHFDFMVITGDLVHEGRKEDYQYFKELLQTHIKTPVFLILGNHDKIGAFQEVFPVEKTDTEYFYSQNFQDYRIIGLDTSANYVSQRQLDWLDEELKSVSENGTILLLHNPVKLLGNHLAVLENSAELLQVIENTDVRLVLGGHVHQRFENSYQNMFFSVIPGTAFGSSLDGEKISFTQHTSYNKITMTKDEISVIEKEYPKHATVYKSFTWEEMQAHDQKYNQ